MKSHIFLVCVASLLNGLVIAGKLPSSFKTCKRNEVSTCLKEILPGILKQLTKPYPGIGLQQMDPYFVKEIKIGAGTKGTVNFQQNYKNCQINGFSNLQLDKVDMDFDKKKLTINGVLPLVDVKSDYDFNGKLLLIPLKGSGKGEVKVVNMGVTIEIDFEEFDKNGKKHYRVTNTKAALSPEKITFKLKNLFDGNKQLGDNLNKVINENWRAVFEDVQPAYENIYANIVKQETNSIFNHVPIDDIFPE